MKILVVGDVIIDRYTHGTRRGLSAETPTIVANFTKEEKFAGGACLVVRNLLRLGNIVHFLTIGGPDELSHYFKKSEDPISNEEAVRLCINQIEIPGWIFTEKRRYFVEQYKLLQYDLINKECHNKRTESVFKKKLEAHLCENDVYDAVIICDNRHGVLSYNISRFIIKRCLKFKIPLYVDSQVSQSSSNHEWYKDSTFIFLNEFELDHVSKKMKKQTETSLLDGAMRFLNSNIVYKRGERGSVVQTERGVLAHPGFKVEAIDTCGAGDAFLAAFVHSNCDMSFANKWAALSTTYKGTIVPKHEDLRKINETVS